MPARFRLALGTLLLAGTIACLVVLFGTQDASHEGGTARLSPPDDASGPSLQGVPPAERSTPPPSSAPTPSSAAAPPFDLAWQGMRLPPAARPPTMALRGRLREADGTPATGALVGARSTGATDAQLLPLFGEGLSDPEGRFEVSAQQTGEIELWVWSRRSPPTVLARHVSPGGAVDLGDVTLPEGLALAGRVLVAGQPSPFGPAAVHVWRQGVTGVTGSFEWGLVMDATGRPLSASRVVTCGADGAWSVEGLSPGAYLVRIQHLGGVQSHEALLPKAPRVVAAPANGVDFDLGASLLAVAPAAAPYVSVPKCRVEVTTAEGIRTRILHPQERGLEHAPPVPVPGVEPGDVLLLVPAGAALDVWVQQDGLEGWRESVVAARAGEVLRITPAPRTAKKGWIKLRRAADAQGLTSHVRVRVTVPGSENVVYEQSTWLPAPDFAGQLELPLGSWDVELRPADPQQASDAELLLLQTERVEIGATLLTAPVLTWTPPRGGRIRLLVEAEGVTRPGVACTLLREGQPDLVPTWRSVIDDFGVPRSSIWVMTSPLVAGARMETDGALAPGGVVLRLECEGFEPHDEPVVIRPGETTEVTVRLVKR